MKDGIIKGTGNSRYLKSNIPEGTTVEQLVAMLRAGTFPIDINGINADGWQQIGDALSKGNLLDDNTCAILELVGANQTVNKAIYTLAMPIGKYAVRVTVLTPGGRPISGVTVTGITNRAGNACVTDLNGTTLGFATSASVTLGATKSGYFDFNAESISKAASLAANTINEVTLSFARKPVASATFANSQSIRFSDDVAKFNCSGIGGGGNGGTGGYAFVARPDSPDNKAHSYYASGAGGGAGYVNNAANLAYSGELITFEIGAATGTTLVKKGSVTVLSSAGGKNGGNGVVSTLITGPGGTPGPAGIGGAYGGVGSTINFDEDGRKIGVKYPTAGNNGSNAAFMYPATTVGGAGAGASAGSSGYANTGYKSGGTPYGGSFSEPVSGSGTGPGGGGAGACGSDTSVTRGAGHSGLAGITWSYKENAA